MKWYCAGLWVLLLINPVGAADRGLLPGVLVEGVEAGHSGAKAGLKKRDVLFAWSCGQKKVALDSPFDMAYAEVERHSCEQPIRVTGKRGTSPRVWQLGQPEWEVRVEPNFTIDLESLYTESVRLAEKGQLAGALERSSRIITEIKNQESWLQPWLTLRLAEVLEEKKEWQQSDELYEAAAQQATGTSPLWLARILYGWAESFYARSDWAQATQYYQQALTEAEKSEKNGLVAARYLNGLGTVALAEGNLIKAKDYFQRNFDIVEHLAPKSLNLAVSAANLGSIAERTGDLEHAEQFFKRDLAITERLDPNSIDLAATLSNLGQVMLSRGESSRGEGYFRAALMITEKLRPRSVWEAYCLNNLGSAAEDEGNLDRAARYFQRSLAIKEKTAAQSLTVANTMARLGEVALKRGDVKGADENFHAALSIREKLAPHSLAMADSLGDLGDLSHARQDLVHAREYYEQALEIKKDLAPGTVSYAETLISLGKTMRDSNTPDSAIDLYARAVTAVETQTSHLGGATDVRTEFRAKEISYYKDLVSLLVAQNRVEESFRVAERSRAQTLLEMLAVGRVDVREGVDSRLLEEQRTLQGLLAEASSSRVRILSAAHTQEQEQAAKKKIEVLVTRLAELESQIRNTSPHYAALTQPMPLSVTEVQLKLLDRDTVLLEYLLGDDRSHMWVVSAESVSCYELPSRAEIERAAHRLYTLMTAPNHITTKETALERQRRLSRAEAEYPRAAVALSRMVLGPLREQLGRKRLLIVRDGALQYIPFSLLPVSGPVSGSSNTVVPLVVDHEVINLPSASVLALLRQDQAGRERKPKSVAVLADPVFDALDSRVRHGSASEQTIGPSGALWPQLTRSLSDIGTSGAGGSWLPRLPFTREEAAAVIGAFPRGQTFVALDFKANRVTATSNDLARYRIVHFATHGLIDSEHPELSGLVLSLVNKTGRPQNGFLALEDVYNLNLPVDMVVLSACDSGLGKLVNGEGLVGLVRGFMYAGASRVLASLWKVDDIATARLMRELYEAMEKENLRPASALREAQIRLWRTKRWHAPYYWAAFELHGEWN